MDRGLHVVLMYLLIHLGLIFFLYPNDIISSSDEGQWMPILIGLILHFVLVWIYMKGLSFFPKKNIIDVYSESGKGFAFFILFPVFIYLLLVNIIGVRAYSEIITIIFLSNTPSWAIIVFFLFISAYLATKGVETIFRTGVILTFVFFPIIFFVLITSFQNADWRYLFPLIDDDFHFITDPSYLKSFSAFTGGFLFLGFVAPFLTYDRKKVLAAAAVLIPFFVLAVYIPVLTFGHGTASTFVFPYIMTVDSIYINWLMFDRVSMFFILCLITFIMVQVSLLLWMAYQIMNHWIPHKPVYSVVTLVIVIFIASLMIIDWKTVEHLLWLNSFLQFYVIFTVPLSIYCIGRRSLRKGLS
ncbi:GerAB/ArcD/ProY family transporter [Alkalihalobacillus sp. AL-G]|uniref:GerAB/ArcD/ProY family transporter n=1 Tax=Alkalihalobacillus sp. AL-G TaxID=2926399 RepID=UPI00272D398B|nr:GerAB/ArcD/ProY family transporter [Alkalihalobacillus sp. AL-G]WLD92949.1 spore germination protein [Alkalihalobacillus sp. AL-G]